MTETSDALVKPATSTRAFDTIIEQIRGLIQEGVLRPGDRLPPERYLATQLGVSRNTLREALRMLEISGLITLRKGSTGGAFIATGDASVVSRSLTDMLQLSGFSLENLAEARLWIQPHMIPAVCERATEDDFARIEANVDEAERLTTLGDWDAAMRVNMDFHILLAEATHNPVMEMVIRSLIDVRREYSYDGGRARDLSIIQDRRRLVGLLRARDAEGAVAEMDRYLRMIHDLWLSGRTPPPRTGVAWAGEQRAGPP